MRVNLLKKSSQKMTEPPQKSEVEKIDTKITIMSKPLIHSVQTEKSGKKVEL